MNLPLIKLDTTIADLYHQHGIHGPFLATTQPVFSNVDLHPELPRESVYPEDEEPFPPDGESEEELNKLRVMVLDMKPVKRIFPLGNMDVVLFTRNHQSAERVVGHLSPEQRPNLHFVDLNQGNVVERLRKLSKGKKVLYWSSQGWMRGLGCLIDLDLSYELVSKKYLITSGMRTPASEMVDLTNQTSHSILRDRKLPFVVKLPRATSGYGTWIVTTEARRDGMISAMERYVKRGGREVLMSAYINLKLDLSVHLVVGAEGDERDRRDPLIVAVSVQSLTVDGHWTGGVIDYSAQTALKGLVRDTVRETGRLLPKGFVGWAGLDIVVDENNRQWVVDLNPRWTGSVPICLLSNHFFQQRGLSHAAFRAFPYEGATMDIYKLLSREISSGRVIINSMAKVDDQLNAADLVWGGQDLEDLSKTAELIKFKLGTGSG